MSKEKYVHTTNIHNMSAPRIIVNRCLGLLNPKSIVDFGCGVGTFLKAFKEKGVTDVLGLDGKWVNRDLLKEYLNENEFKETDLEQVITLDKKYDIAISLEVAEHLKESIADTLVKNLVNASDVILFSAAIPFQGGQNHINEQWPDYWVKKFKTHGFEFVDTMRDEIWNEEKVNWWYKQNMFFVVNETIINTIGFKQNNSILSKIHPEHYLEKINAYNNFRTGKGRPKAYLKLFIKSILYKLSLSK